MQHARLTAGSLLLAIAVAGSAGATAAAPGAPSPVDGGRDVTAGAFCPDAQEREFLRLINNYRASRSVGALAFSATLGAAADHYSRQMANQNYFGHDLQGGVTWVENVVAHGYAFNTYKGENIAAGRSTAADTFTQWRNSPGHNANMLSSNFKAIGIGRAYNAASTYDSYWTTAFGGRVDAGPSC